MDGYSLIKQLMIIIVIIKGRRRGGKIKFFEEPGICNSATKNTFTYQLENILFIQKTGEVVFQGSQIHQIWRILRQNF